MHVHMVQHAVGQGGFSTGVLVAEGSSLSWAYDCGSTQVDALVREIRQVASAGPIDFLFLSHLDSDHISGVDRLLSQCQVREVVLPYLEQEVVVAMIARDAEIGRLTGLFLDAVPDIAAWLAGRGVETITFIRGPDDDEDTPGPPDLPTPRGDGVGDIKAEWNREPERVWLGSLGRRDCRRRKFVKSLLAL
jgi:glyoxylase-like metal-dependent hydrolase (beta-lactamase superfamily II)